MKHIFFFFVIWTLLTSINSSNVPKLIWSFWDSDDIPGFIQRCVDTWKELNPDFEIHLVRKTNLEFYIGQDKAKEILNWKYSSNSPQIMVDLVRLELLQQHGGVWLDASTVLYQPLDWLSKEGECIVYGFYEKRSKNITLEPSAIACVPNHPFIRDWNFEMRTVDRYNTIKDYLQNVEPEANEVDAEKYYLTHIAGRIAFNKNKENIKVLNTWEGPLNYWKEGGLETLCVKKAPLAKIFSYYRQQLITHSELEKCVFVPRNKEVRFQFNNKTA